MLNWFVKKFNNKKGFTLVELIVVIAILGILAAIAVPRFTGATANANRKTVEANLRTIDGAVAMYEADTGGLPTAIDNLSSGTNATLQSTPEGPDGVTYILNSTTKKAEAVKGSGTGTWWGTAEGNKSLPVTW